MIKKLYSYRLIVAAILIISLAACVSSPSDRDGDLSGAPGTDIEELAALLELAENSPSPLAESYFLEAARILLGLGREAEANNILNTINTDNLDPALASEILLQRAQLLIQSNRPELALNLLNSSTLRSFPQLADAQQITFRLLRAQAYLDTGNFAESVRERVYVDSLLRDSALEQNHEQIWNVLNAMPAEQLQTLASEEINFEFQGWYELGVIGKTYQYNLDRQLTELESWRQRWSRHPAASYLPQALQLVETMAQERPESIALLLPLTTTPGMVVRDGFMSAYFSAKKIGGKTPVIRFYNTDTDTDIIELHRQARADGAAMIIGPLLRQNVARLQTESDLGVPTLALNNIQDSQPASDLFYQFALSPENEAQQIASRAWRDGHRYAAVLSPLDEPGTDFYARKRNSFIEAWENLGGQIVTREIFRDDYTDVIETLLDLSDSEYRKELLSDLIGESLEFTQRRRQDIDFIFLIAQPGAARQINPRLAYLYAGDIPVYASQDIYSGISRPFEDADLNGILFSDSPWLLSDIDELKTETQALFPQGTAFNLRLQAFGIDAFRLYPRLRQLEAVPDSQVYGATGLLKFGANKNIIRELSWARIENGQAKLLNQIE
ncbi:penicillin-binding protein activator [Gammaproteobacteria bacterium]|nr:penicillin-binding protein activator [Gammaproteobacteria bacterium]